MHARHLPKSNILAFTHTCEAHCVTYGHVFSTDHFTNELMKASCMGMGNMRIAPLKLL